MKRILFFMLFSLAGAFYCDSILSQGVAVMPGGQVQLSGFGEVDLEKSIEQWSEREKSRSMVELSLRVDLIQTVCELSESETRKLRFACKGVVSKRVKSGAEQLRAFFYASQLVPEDPADETPLDKEYSDKLTPYCAANNGNGIVEVEAYFEKKMTDYPLWNKTLASTLTEDQLQAYQESLTSRNRMFVKAAVAKGLAELDTEVFLSEQQRDRIESHAIEMLEQSVTSEVPGSVTQASGMYRNLIDPVSDYKAILSKAQLVHLKSKRNREQKTRSKVSWGARPNR